jgi:hypothetical protein
MFLDNFTNNDSYHNDSANNIDIDFSINIDSDIDKKNDSY